MPTEVNFMVGGAAGQGVQTIGFILSKTMSRGGFHVFSDQFFESRIRGGHNFFRIRASENEVKALNEELDVLIALNRETIDLHQQEVKENGLTIFDAEAAKIDLQGPEFLDVPMERLAVEVASNKVMSNTVATGAVLGLVDYDFGVLADILKEHFARAGAEIVEGNLKAAWAGFEYGRDHRGEVFGARIKPMAEATRRMLITANEAIAMGALAAGCKFYAGYPMTPSTEIMEFLADKGRPYNVAVVQPEDEISVINMVVGAAYAGARAMTGTSGGGFCLMVEALSLAGMTETPVVVVLGQRPGPAIGLPTRTEQGELLFALNAGHGEFPRAILAPATVEDSFHVTVKAFNLAEKYQTPVIIIHDQHIATSYNTVDKFDLSQVKIDRGLLISEEESNRLAGEYKRHQITDSGVSPRAFPLVGKSLVVTDSDEHDEEGHLNQDTENRIRMHSKRIRKFNGLKTEVGPPRFHQTQGAEMTLIGWGGTYGAIKEASELLEQDGMAVNVLHLNELWPFPDEAVASALNNGTKSIVVENNATGQLAKLIRQETGIKVNGVISKFDGRPFSPKYIVEALRKEVF